MLLNNQGFCKIIFWIMQVWLISALDIEECNYSTPPPCSWSYGLCEYKEGSDFCLCRVGWELGSDNSSCVDIDECSNLKKACPLNEEKCANTIGSYSCKCKSGWILSDDKASCVDIDECKGINPPCSEDEECVNLRGGYTCKCKIGFQEEQNKCVASCNKTCDTATSKCILTDGLESCQCYSGYSKIHTNNNDNSCVPNCSQTCDAVKARCIVENGAALCKCKVEYGIGSGLASDGNNSCSNFIIGNIPILIQKSNRIAFMPELPKEYLVSFDIYPITFKSGIQSVVAFVADQWKHAKVRQYTKPALSINFVESGKLHILSFPFFTSGYGFLSDYLELNMWSSIEISQHLNGAVYAFRVKINKRTVFSKTKESIQSFKFVHVFASLPFYNNLDGKIKNFYFKITNQYSEYSSMAIPPKGLSFDSYWVFDNLEKYLNINHKVNHIKPIYADLEKHKEAQGFWLPLPNQIVVVIDTLQTNVNMVLSAIGYAVKNCEILIGFDKYPKKVIELRSGVFQYFKLRYGIKDLDFPHSFLNISSKNCYFSYLLPTNISFEDINECTSLEPPCSWSNGVCENTYGSYLCKCAKGWRLEGNSCIDINECTDVANACSWSMGVCENTMGGYICKCEPGWMLNGNICIDINECNATTSLCSWGNGICHNTNGSYFCTYLREFQNNSSFAYSIIENATRLFKENFIALIPTLNKEFLVTFNIFLNKFNGSQRLICLALISKSCDSSVLSIDVDPDGSLVFFKVGLDHYNKFKHPIRVGKWINIEISQLSSIRKNQYNYTIKIDKIIVFSVIIQNKHKYDHVIVMASDSFYDAQDCLIEKFYFINGKLYDELSVVVIHPEGLNLKKAWIPDDEFHWSRLQNIGGKLKGKAANRDTNILGFWTTTNLGLRVFIDPFWTDLPYIKLNFRLSIILYALRPSNLSVNYKTMKEDFTLTNIELISNSFVTSETDLTFDKDNFSLIFYIDFIRVNNNPIYLISVNASLEDINECNDTSRCPGTNSECENTFGSYLCKCKTGFLSKANDSCVDINECNDTSRCPWTNSVCLNTNGSFLCKCEYGWKLGEDNASCINSAHSVPASVLKVNVSILVPVLLVLIILVVVIVLWIRRSKKFQPAGLNQDPNALENYLDYQKLTTDKWEILPSNIIFGKKIGEGAFGNVFIAKIKALTFAKMNHLNHLFDDLCNINEDSTINVAVKLIKDGASDLEYNDFVNEITLMKGIGYHKNIVNMIGCCTFRKYLCLVNEFMENGDLLHFLRNTRIKFTSSNDEIEAQVRFIYTHTNPQLFEKTKLMQNEIPLMDMEPIKSSDLLSFAWQIASGMEYLSCIKLVHRDLAARNILVGAKKNLKISDFGLTCKLNDEANYTGKTNRRLPIKWMSVEAIFYRLFTTYSDVWSYGVVLFEIVTLGGTPYSTISNRELLSLLKSGYRMERPDNCSQTVYDIMLRCWNQDPLMRPTFTELRELFEKIMSHGDRYVSLDIDKENAYYKTNSSSSSDKIDELKQEEVLLSSKTSRRI